MTLRWWKCPEMARGGRGRYNDAIAGAIWQQVDRLRMYRRNETIRDLIHEAIFEGKPISTLGASPAISSFRMSRSAPMTVNIARSKVEAVTSRLGKKRPMPVISCDDATWTERHFAQRASKALRGKLATTETERMTPMVLRDSVIRGTGATKVYCEGGDVQLWRVPRNEILVDPRDGRYGQPREMIHVQAVQVDVLCAMFPDHKDAIQQASRVDVGDEWSAIEYVGTDAALDRDFVLVAEAWHLESKPGHGDGRHAWAVRGRTLYSEEWTRTRFPFAFSHWSPPVRGFWGRGLIEDLAGLQLKINDVARDIQEALYYGSQLTIFNPRGSKIPKAKFKARHPNVIDYEGALPTYVAPLPVSPQLFEFFSMLLTLADDLSGLARDYTSGKTQLGAGASGKAMDTLYDIQSDRFAMPELNYALYRVDLGALIIDEARSLVEESKDPKSDIKPSDLAPWIRDIAWSKVDLDDNYSLKLEPINFLPDTRAGKLETASEMTAAGLITDPITKVEMFEEPDIMMANRDILGPRRRIRDIQEGLADPDVDMLELLLDAYQDIDGGIKLVQADYNDALAAKPRTPEAVLSRYRQWLEHALDEQRKAKGATAAMAPAGGAPAPGGGPMLGEVPPEMAIGGAGGMLPPGAAAPPMGTPLPTM